MKNKFLFTFLFCLVVHAPSMLKAQTLSSSQQMLADDLTLNTAVSNLSTATNTTSITTTNTVQNQNLATIDPSAVQTTNSCSYTGSLVDAKGVGLDLSQQPGRVLQEIPHNCLPIKVILMDDNGKSYLLLQDLNTNKTYRLASEISDNLVAPTWEGTNKVILDKSFFGQLKLPSIYAKTAVANGVSRLVMIPLYDGLQSGSTVDAGEIQTQSNYAYATPSDKNVTSFITRSDYSHEVYAIVDGKVMFQNMAGIQYAKGELLTGVQVKQLSATDQVVTELAVRNYAEQFWLVWVIDGSSTPDGYSQLELYRKIGDYKTYTETQQVITKSAADKFQPVIHLGQKAVVYYVKDEATDLYRIATHFVIEADTQKAITSCNEYFFTSADPSLETTALSNNYVFPNWNDPWADNLTLQAKRLYQVCDGQQVNFNDSVTHELRVSSELKNAVATDVCDVSETAISEKLLSLVQPVLVGTVQDKTLDCSTTTKTVDCGQDMYWDEKLQSCMSVYQESTCQAGYVKLLDGTCAPEQQTATCPEGYHTEAGTKQCVPNAVACSEGYTFNQATQQCEIINVTPTCPEGSKLDVATNQCVYDAICPAGTTFDQKNNICVYPVVDCPEGTVLNQDSQCVHEVVVEDCPEGSTLDQSLNQCVYEVESCPQGSELNVATNQCVYPIQDAKCPAGSTLDQKDQVCVYPAVCPEGSKYDPDLRECLYQASVMDCPKGTELSVAINQCVYPIADCPEGATLNANTNQCEYAILGCPEGTIQTVAGDCITPPAEDDCMDDLAQATTVGGVPTQSKNCEKPQLQVATCPKGTYAGYKGECLSPVNQIVVINNYYNYSSYISVDYGVAEEECPDGYEKDAESGVCYQLLEDQVSLIANPASTGTETESQDVVDDVNQGGSLSSGGFMTEGGVFGCSLSTTAMSAQSTSGFVCWIGVLSFVFIRLMTSLRRDSAIDKRSK